MAKRIDITDKLSFDENPILVIKGKEIMVNAEASTVLGIMGLSKKAISGQEAALEAYEKLFNESARNKLEELNLQFKDLEIVIQEAMGLVQGEENQGEQ